MTGTEDILDEMQKSYIIKFKIFSIESELTSLNSCLYFLEDFSESYFPTSLEEDMEIYNKGNLSDNLLNALNYRITRKKIIKNYINIIKYLINIIRSGISIEIESDEKIINDLLDTSEFELWFSSLKFFFE